MPRTLNVGLKLSLGGPTVRRSASVRGEKWSGMKLNRFVLGGLLSILVAGCGAGDERGGSEDLSGGQTLSLGAHGAGVVAAREFLTQFGYFPNDRLQQAYPDWQPMVPASKGDPALFDESLKQAVQKYQKNLGLVVSGELDATTLEAMRAPRCGVPDTDPERASSVDKWALIGAANRWNKTAIKYKINQPNVVLQGLFTKEVTKAAILAGFATWHATTNLTFTEVTSGEDFLVDYRDLGTGGTIAQGSPPPSAGMIINSRLTYTAASLRMTVAHEAGHVIGLHHSSNYVAGTTGQPLMSPSGNSTGSLINDDKIASNVLYNVWEQLPGLAYDIGVGVGGSVWIIGQGAREPFRWNGSSWVQVTLGQPCSRVDVDDLGHPWVVAATNVIYRHDGSKWSELPGGGRAFDIGIGTNGFVFAIGTDGRSYRYGNNVWSFVGGPSGGTSIDVDMSGNFHVVAANNELWTCNNGCFREAGGLGLDVGYGGPPGFTFGTENWGWAIGLNDTIWARDKQVEVPSANPGSFTPAADTWVNTPGAARRISVGPNGRPWLVASNGNIYRRAELP